MRAPTGAWLRAGISRDGGPFTEADHVVWLQVGELYADSRGFAGSTTYDRARVRWLHEVGTPGDDSGVLEPQGDGLLERGDGYLERWVPLPGEVSPVGAWTGGGARVVRVGDHVVHVGPDGTGVHLSSGARA